MSALLELAKSLGIDPGSLNQADLQEQVCSKALAQIETLTREREEALAYAERIRDAFDVLMANSHGVAGLHLNGEVASWSDLTEGGRFEEWLPALSEQPPAALAALKAEWQAEAVQSILDECEHWSLMGPWGILVEDISEKLEMLYQRAREAGE